MKKSLTAILSLLLFCTVSFAQTDKKAAASSSEEPDFKFEVEEYNFGTVKEGDKVEYEFRFTNAGNEPLIISNVQSTCGCTVPDWPKEPIQKGQTAGIKVIFNSAGKVGLQNRPITIFSNGKTSPKVVHLKGNVEKTADKE
ncbi:MAG: DUF1573 domain-containing protein [Bacteroidia bacterium]